MLLPPFQLAHLWRYFLELHSWRGESQSLKHADILAWALLTHRYPSQFDLDVLGSIEFAYWRVQSAKAESPPGTKSIVKQMQALRTVNFNPVKK